MVSRLTAYAIANNPNIVIVSGGPDKNGKFAGQITLGLEDYYRPLLSTQPTYSSSEAAENAMKELVVRIKEFVTKDITNPNNPIKKFMESPEGEIFQSIISIAKENRPES